MNFSLIHNILNFHPYKSSFYVRTEQTNRFFPWHNFSTCSLYSAFWRWIFPTSLSYYIMIIQSKWSASIIKMCKLLCKNLDVIKKSNVEFSVEYLFLFSQLRTIPSCSWYTSCKEKIIKVTDCDKVWILQRPSEIFV